MAVVARDGVAGFSSGQQGAPTPFFTRWVQDKFNATVLPTLARPWSWERCRYRCGGLPSSSAEHAGIFQQEQDFEQQSPGARYPDASPLGTVRCDALRIFDGPGTGDGTVVATEAPERDNSSLLREKESARPRRAPFYMVSSMIAFTMSPSFARSALTALDREQDAWDMTSSTSSSSTEPRDMWHENM